jgi:hypothetical protein
MSFMAVFDADGRCKYVLDGSPGSVDVSTEAAVVYVEENVNPNTVWYDHVFGEMITRSPFRVLVSSNKIENIPVGTTAYIGLESIVVNDGAIEFDVAYPQQIRVVLIHVRHMDTIVEVPCEVQG